MKKAAPLLFLLLVTLIFLTGCMDQQMAKETRKKHWLTVIDLMEKGANPNTPVKLAFGRNSTVLIQAVKKGKYNVISAALTHGADANGTDNKQRVPLQFLGSTAADVDIARLLIEYGADIDYTASRTFSPLTHAVSYNNSALVDLYLERGADVNLSSSHSLISPLIKAAERGNTSIVKKLVLVDAQLDYQDKNGKTALMAAAENGNQHIIDLLIDLGASDQIKDNNGNDYNYYYDNWLVEQQENSSSSSDSE